MSVIQFTNFKILKEVENSLKVLIVENNLRPTTMNETMLEIVKNEIELFKNNEVSIEEFKQFNEDFQIELKFIINQRRALEEALAGRLG